MAKDDGRQGKIESQLQDYYQKGNPNDDFRQHHGNHDQSHNSPFPWKLIPGGGSGGKNPEYGCKYRCNDRYQQAIESSSQQGFGFEYFNEPGQCEATKGESNDGTVIEGKYGK